MGNVFFESVGFSEAVVSNQPPHNNSYGFEKDCCEDVFNQTSFISLESQARSEAKRIKHGGCSGLELIDSDRARPSYGQIHCLLLTTSSDIQDLLF